MVTTQCLNARTTFGYSYISICALIDALTFSVDGRAEKLIGWQVSVLKLSITHVFVLEKAGTVTNNTF